MVDDDKLVQFLDAQSRASSLYEKLRVTSPLEANRLDLSNDAQAAQRLAHTLAYQIAMTVAHDRAATRLVSMSHG